MKEEDVLVIPLATFMQLARPGTTKHADAAIQTLLSKHALCFSQQQPPLPDGVRRRGGLPPPGATTFVRDPHPRKRPLTYVEQFARNITSMLNKMTDSTYPALSKKIIACVNKANFHMLFDTLTNMCFSQGRKGLKYIRLHLRLLGSMVQTGKSSPEVLEAFAAQSLSRLKAVIDQMLQLDDRSDADYVTHNTLNDQLCIQYHVLRSLTAMGTPFDWHLYGEAVCEGLHSAAQQLKTLASGTLLQHLVELVANSQQDNRQIILLRLEPMRAQLALTGARNGFLLEKLFPKLEEHYTRTSK